MLDLSGLKWYEALLTIIFVIILCCALYFLYGWIIQMIWNYAITYIFASLPQISLGHGIGLAILIDTCKSRSLSNIFNNSVRND